VGTAAGTAADIASDTATNTATAAGAAPLVVRTRAVGLLAAGLAHDLNNMLAGIVATAELLRERLGDSSDEGADLAAIIAQSAKASALVRQILAFSRQETLVPVTEPLDRLLDSLGALLEPLVGRQLQLARGCGADVRVRVDPTALERSVVNLALNARAAAGADGHIRLSTEQIEPDGIPAAARAFMPPVSYAVVRVEDDGPGVDPAHVARIFEPYFTTRKGGQGLGLATAYGLVKQSGGFLLYDRSGLGGARFSIFLPEVEPRRQKSPRPLVDTVPVVLLVEDDLLLRMSMARGLERQGFRVRQAADGAGAWRRLLSERPSLLLSDIRMAGMDGVTLTQAARRLYPDLPVLLVSGYADEAARAAMPDLGVAFLAKPFTLQTLGERVRGLV